MGPSLHGASGKHWSGASFFCHPPGQERDSIVSLLHSSLPTAASPYAPLSSPCPLPPQSTEDLLSWSETLAQGWEAVATGGERRRHELGEGHQALGRTPSPQVGDGQSHIAWYRRNMHTVADCNIQNGSTHYQPNIIKIEFKLMEAARMQSTILL